MAVNARREAWERLGGRYEVRVLEPSPPAVNTGPWFADDPVERDGVPAGATLVSPVGTGDLLWDDLAREDAELAAWCAARWLGAWRRLEPVPPMFAETRMALHSLAEHVVSPARQRANGKIGLRFTRGGFGTPFFGAEAQVRVEGDVLVVQRGDVEQRGQITSLKDAAEFVGFDLTRSDAALDDGPLRTDAEAGRFLGDWYGFATSVLEQLRAEAPAALGASRVQLWPEHFDVGVELGPEGGGVRAAYGASPGDEHHAEPYLYVAPWTARPVGELWNAVHFPGAELPYAALLAAEDQRAAALEFLRSRLAALTDPSGGG